LTVQRIGCTNCGRTVYARGAARIVEAARTLDGEELVAEYLAKVSLAREADIAMVLDEYARLGVLRVPQQLNQLRGRLMEFKVGDSRLPFYETRDAGHALMVARITHGFTKRSQRTPRRQIDRGIWVISQDEQPAISQGEQPAISEGEQPATGEDEQA